MSLRVKNIPKRTSAFPKKVTLQGNWNNAIERVSKRFNISLEEAEYKLTEALQNKFNLSEEQIKAFKDGKKLIGVKFINCKGESDFELTGVEKQEEFPRTTREYPAGLPYYEKANHLCGREIHSQQTPRN